MRCGGHGPAWSGVCGEEWWCVCVVQWTSRGCGGGGGHVVYAVVWWPGIAVRGGRLLCGG